VNRIPTRTEPGKREAVRGLFASIAGRYDLLNRLLSAGMDRRWRAKAVRLFSAEVRSVLDVAAGTGDLSAAWLAARPEGSVLATDFVPEMCRLGAEKLRGRPRLRGYAVADALALPFPDGAFDGAMVAFGVRNFEDTRRGLAEMARVLRPGGELLVLEFFPSRSTHVERLFRFYFRRVLPRLGGWISGERSAYEYLPRSVGQFHSRREFLGILRELGLEPGRMQEYSGGVASALLARKLEPIDR